MKSSYITYVEGFNSKGELIYWANGVHDVVSNLPLSAHEFLDGVNPDIIKDAKAANPQVASVVIKNIMKI